MSPLARRQHPRASFAVFALATLALLAAYAVAIPWLARNGHEPLPDWTLAIDLLIVLPLLWWWLQPAPRGRAAAFGAVAVAMLGVAAGAWLLPAENKSVWLWLEPMRWLLLGALALVQLALAGLTLRELAALLAQRQRALARGERPAALLETGLHAVIERRALALARRTGAPLGPGLKWIQADARLWLYALAPRRWLEAATPAAGERWFGVHRQGQNLSNQTGFAILVAAEIPIAHLFVHLMFGPTVAAVVTALGVYGALYLWAETRATRWRPLALDSRSLQIRHGLIDDLHVPRAVIVGVDTWRGQPPRRAAGRLRFVGMGRANLRLALAPGTRLHTLFGEREVGEIFLGVDEPERLLQALRKPGPTPR
jgi:hypothetical protein